MKPEQMATEKHKKPQRKMGLLPSGVANFVIG
jgi:hypothetical protein